MIDLKIKETYIQSLYFDHIPAGRSAFTQEGEYYTSRVSKEAFDGFLKDNNLIVYRNSIKGYENGEVYGEFMQ